VVCDDPAVNLLDLAAILLLVVSVALGFRSGALPQIGGLAGAVAGGALALIALPFAETALESLDPTTRALAVLIGLLAAVALGEGLGSGVGRSLGQALGNGVLGALDRVAGGLVGAAQAILIVWLAGGLFAAGPVRSLAQEAQTSTAVRALSAILPPPTETAVVLGRMLETSGLPDVFIGLEPLPAPPVDVPADAQARAIAALATPSTVKVTAQTCGALSSGTGFAIASGYVVTNAHVVAGSRLVRVALDGQPFDATTVVFDPDLDVALLLVDGFDAPALAFASADPVRGATGVALGFPNGAGLTTIPAAVTDEYEARGRDIYGVDQVPRQILELRARVDRGDSCGPFVLADGTVGGVVFAEARTDDDVGYALSPTRVATRVRPGIGRTERVETGACLQ
jgi:S1-C subfamily serine protease